MKVAFLIYSPEVSGCRYRVLQYLPYLKQQGVEASVHFFKRKWLEKLRFYNALGEYDVVYIHRKLFPPIEFGYIRRKARKIIYDFDDAVMYRSSRAKNPYSLSRRMKFAYTAKRVDSIVAGNQFLKSEALPYNPCVEVIPTSVDLSRYTVRNPGFRETQEPLLTLGWLGSKSTLEYLKNLMPTLEDLYRQHPLFKLKIVCDQFLDSPQMPVINKQWTLEEEVSDLRSFDIGLMPLSDDPWARGKCGLKILQYYGAGLPVVCTPVGVNRDIVQDGVNGFWARNEQEWRDRLLQLLREERIRREMGLEGRRAVERAYCLEVNAPRLFDILRRMSAPEGATSP